MQRPLENEKKLRESAHMLDYNNLLLPPRIETNTKGEPVMQNVGQKQELKRIVI